MVISCLKVGFLFGEVMRAVTPPPLCCEWNFAEKGEGDNEGFLILFKYFIYPRALEEEKWFSYL